MKIYSGITERWHVVSVGGRKWATNGHFIGVVDSSTDETEKCNRTDSVVSFVNRAIDGSLSNPFNAVVPSRLYCDTTFFYRKFISQDHGFSKYVNEAYYSLMARNCDSYSYFKEPKKEQQYIIGYNKTGEVDSVTATLRDTISGPMLRCVDDELETYRKALLFYLRRDVDEFNDSSDGHYFESNFMADVYELQPSIVDDLNEIDKIVAEKQ